MKKLLSLALVLVMLLTQFVFPSFADFGDFDIFDDEVFEDKEWEDPYAGLKVESIQVEATREVIENVDGYFDEDEGCFIYDIYYAEPYFTVVFENGEEEACLMDELYEGVYYDDYQYEKPWGIGKHQVTGSYRDAEFSFEVEVVENPVKSIAAVAQKSLVEGWDCYEDYYFDENDNEVPYTGYNLYSAEPIFTITMKDGTVYTGTDEEIFDQTGYYTYEGIDQLENSLKVGKNTVKFVYMGIECDCEIEILPNPYESITISGENEIILEFNGVDDKDSFKTKIVSWDGMSQEGGAWGVAITEDGKEYWIDYYCYVDEDGNTYLNKDVYLKVGPFTTNTLETNNWLLAYFSAQDVFYYSMSYYMVSDNFKGYFSDEEINIDDLVAISTYVCEMEPAGENEDGYVHTLKVSEVEENIKTVFGLTDVDAKKSSFYNKLSRKVVVEEPFDNGVEYTINEFVFEDGKWVLYADSYSLETGEFVGEMAVILNEDLTIDSIYFTQKTIELGDVNCDGVVTAVDARLVLQYVAGLVEDYELNMYYADVNGDGYVTAVDARIILQKVAGLVE